MLKVDEIGNERSCLNKAFAKEMLFVLLARDAAAPVAIRAWVNERMRIGKNKFEDAQIQDALNVAVEMEKQRKDSF